MKHVLIFGIVAAVVSSASPWALSDIVDPEVILELQPQTHELGDMFDDPTVQQMLNRGYTHLANLTASGIGGLLMEELGAWLVATGYGVLQYGAHGGANGETGGESFSTLSDAQDKMAWLIQLQYFTADELTILAPPGQPPPYYFISFTSKRSVFGAFPHAS